MTNNSQWWLKKMKEIKIDGTLDPPFRSENGIQCEKCGMKMFEGERQRKEMKLHEKECTGHRKADEKFEKGDRVKYSDFGLKRLDREQRKGKVVGFGRDNKGVRVKWDGNKTASKYSLDFIKGVK